MDSFEVSLLRQHTTQGIADRLCAWARQHTGAIDALLWLPAGAGLLAPAGALEQAQPARDLGLDTLPCSGPPACAPPPWRGLHWYSALALPGEECAQGVLTLAFESEPAAALPYTEPLVTGIAFAAAVLERNAARSALATAQNEAIARMGAGLAHTLGNVLQAALSAVEGAQSLAPDAARTALADASAALRRASGITRQLAALGGIGHERQPTEIGALVSGLVAALEDQMPSGISLTIDHAVGEAWVDVDPAAIEAAVADLIHAAREALGAMGAIRVAVRHRASTRRWVEIEVWHDARESDEAERATLPIVVTAMPHNDGGDTQGAGQIGLAIVRAAIARHGGTVERRVMSPSGGVTVVRLPAIAKQASAVMPTTHLPQAVRVLVADDEPAVLRGVQRLLSAAGHSVLSARDGAEAVALARVHRDLGMALVDLTMPNLGGPPLVAALRRVAPELPVVVMTGYASDEMVRALRREGASMVLKKPVPGPALLDALRLARAVPG